MAVPCRTFCKICTLYTVIYICIFHGDDARCLLRHMKKNFLASNYTVFELQIFSWIVIVLLMDVFLPF